jgi:redox-regulated HSP33 family molecular chaperone
LNISPTPLGHVEAGPTRTRENADKKNIERILQLLQNTPSMKVVDITGKLCLSLSCDCLKEELLNSILTLSTLYLKLRRWEDM